MKRPAVLLVLLAFLLGLSACDARLDESRRFPDLVLWLSTPRQRALTAPVATASLPASSAAVGIEVALPCCRASMPPTCRRSWRASTTTSPAQQHAGLSRRHLRVLLVKAGLRVDDDDE
jgi:hypothetical protein